MILGALERQERSHAAWRSFFSKKLIPMLRGDGFWNIWWRRVPARSANANPNANPNTNANASMKCSMKASMKCLQDSHQGQ